MSALPATATVSAFVAPDSCPADPPAATSAASGAAASTSTPLSSAAAPLASGSSADAAAAAAAATPPQANAAASASGAAAPASTAPLSQTADPPAATSAASGAAANTSTPLNSAAHPLASGSSADAAAAPPPPAGAAAASAPLASTPLPGGAVDVRLSHTKKEQLEAAREALADAPDVLQELSELRYETELQFFYSGGLQQPLSLPCLVKNGTHWKLMLVAVLVDRNSKRHYVVVNLRDTTDPATASDDHWASCVETRHFSDVASDAATAVYLLPHTASTELLQLQLAPFTGQAANYAIPSLAGVLALMPLSLRALFQPDPPVQYPPV